MRSLNVELGGYPMTGFLTGLSFQHLALLTLPIPLIHFFEEVPRFVPWATEHVRDFYLNYRDKQKVFYAENALMFAVAIVTIVLLNIFPGNRVLQGLVLGGAVIFLQNTWFHTKKTLSSGIYSPGVVTASLLFPFTAFLMIWKANQVGIFTLQVVIIAIVYGMAFVAGLVVFTHRVIFIQ